MLQYLLSLDSSLLISAGTIIGPEYSILIQILGESIVIFVALILISIWLYGIKIQNEEYKKNAMRIFATIILVYIIYAIINLWVPQWRPGAMELSGATALIPHPTDNSFPSGHALFSAAAIIGFWRYFYKNTILVLLLILTIITTLSRIIGGVHYPGDIVGGLLFGTIGAILLRSVVTSRIMEEKIYPFFLRVAGWIKL